MFLAMQLQLGAAGLWHLHTSSARLTGGASHEGCLGAYGVQQFWRQWCKSTLAPLATSGLKASHRRRGQQGAALTAVGRRAQIFEEASHVAHPAAVPAARRIPPRGGKAGKGSLCRLAVRQAGRWAARRDGASRSNRADTGSWKMRATSTQR